MPHGGHSAAPCRGRGRSRIFVLWVSSKKGGDLAVAGDVDETEGGDSWGATGRLRGLTVGAGPVEVLGPEGLKGVSSFEIVGRRKR